MSRDTPVDWTQLTDPEQALRWSLRGEDDYDSYQKDNQFVARVIFADDEHSKVSASELLAVFGTMVSSDSAAEVRKFRGRIIGKNSPHSFLPDPCNPDFQGEENEELTKNLINLHTLFYVMNADGATPNVNSYWLVTLNASGCPGAPFNLQFAQAIEVISETEKQVAAAEKACEALEKLDWDGGSPLGTYGSSGGTNTAKGGHSRQYKLDDSPELCAEDNDKFWMMNPLGASVKITSFYDSPRCCKDQDPPCTCFHKALDMSALVGVPVLAAAPGVVSHFGAKCGHCGDGPDDHSCPDKCSGGKVVYIDHGTYPDGNHYKSAAMHLDRFEPGVTNGSTVQRGDIVGYIGMTGNTSGPHLHFHLSKTGDWSPDTDPLEYIKRNEKCPSPEKLAAIEAQFKRMEDNCVKLGATFDRKEKKCVTGVSTGEADV